MASFEPQDRNYSAWTFTDCDVNYNAFDPVRDKMLVGDTIYSNTIERTSKYRGHKSIPGILVYDGKTYGRHGGKMLYKCVPNDRQLPAFLIPYAPKGTAFQKCKTNKFVLFQLVEWTGKHPLGMITNTLGEVSDLSVFYNYQLFCKEIHVPIQKFVKAANVASKNKQIIPDWVKHMEDRTSVQCITIDPEGSVDFDDALSVVEKADGGHIFSVYISNVAATLDIYQLWDHVTNRVATIYLPDSKRPMLPPILSDDLCSLVEGQQRFVLAMDITLTSESIIESVDFVNCVIEVTNNYVYEEKALLENSLYQEMYRITQILCGDGMYIDDIVDSHDVVSYYMLMMNHQVGKILMKEKCGIFRGVTVINSIKHIDCASISKDIKRVVSLWRNTKGDYETFEVHKGHQLIGEGLDAYAQVTSPIRRMVDLVNLVELQKIMGVLPTKSKMHSFVDEWMNKVDYMNQSMKSISKVQNDCQLLHRCFQYDMDGNYVGYVIEASSVESSIPRWKYAVHLPKLNMTSYVETTVELEMYISYRFSLHLFVDESTLKQKVRIQYIS
jgi:exoribonuclease R